MKKGVRAQVTIFIIIAIIAIVIILAFGITVYQKNKTEKDMIYFQSLEIKPQFERLQTFIFDCREMSARDALDAIGIQGGYHKRIKDVFIVEGSFIPFYYNQGQITIPTKDDIAVEIENAFNENIIQCLRNNEISEFTLSFNKPKTEVNIGERLVYFESDININIEKESHSIVLKLKEMPFEISSALYDIYDIAFYITDSHRENPAMYCIDCVADMAEEKNLYVDMIPMQDDLSLVIISENYTYSEPYSFMFLNKYKGNEQSPEPDIGGNEVVPEAL